MSERDLAEAGLLDGLEGTERAARVKLLQRLHEGGCTLDQLHEGTTTGALQLLAVQRLLERRRVHTMREAEATAAFPPGFVERNHRAIGLPLPDPDEPVYDDEQVENLRTLLAMMEAGLPEDDLHLLGRILGQSSRRTAEAIVDVLSRALAQPGDTDSDVALRMADFAEAMLPMVPRLTGAVLRLHLLDVVQEEAVAGLESDTGGVAGEREVAVAFADLAGFTALSEEIGIEELGRVAGRFEALVTAVAEPPVRLVKVLGDGAMLVSADPDALVSAMLALVDAAEGLPPVHAGVAYGPALHSVGDWLGHTVNVAARLCAAAPPRAVIATPQVREAGDGTIAWEDAGTFALRGISEPVAALRARRPRASAAAVR